MDLERIAFVGHRFTNWSRTFECRPELYFIPDTVDEIREILLLAKSEGKRVRVVGCGNSPSDIACCDDYLLSLQRFHRVLHIDADLKEVTVQAGCVLTQLNQVLQQNGLALPVLGSISEATIGGVISTGTHGTGYQTGLIADYVTSLRVILPSGDVLLCSRSEHSELLHCVLCGLGALGVILEVTLQCEAKFYLHQLSYPCTLESVLERLDENVESCDHFRFLWFPHTDYVSVSITNRVNGPFLQLNRLQLTGNGHSDGSSDVSDLSSDSFEHVEFTNPYGSTPYRLTSECTWWQRALDWLLHYGIGYHVLQLAYYASTWWPSLVPVINRAAFWLLYSSNQVRHDVSYRIFNFECLFQQYVNEWAIPRSKTGQVLRELKQMIEQTPNLYAHFPVEVRFTASSDIYLAPSYGRDTTFINIICYRPYGKFVEHQPYWDRYEHIVKKAGGRPHWAKAHRETAVDLVRMYPYFRAWWQVRRRVDPQALFTNAYLNRIYATFPSGPRRLSFTADATAGDEPSTLSNLSTTVNTSTPKLIQDDHDENQDDDDDHTKDDTNP